MYVYIYIYVCKLCIYTHVYECMYIYIYINTILGTYTDGLECIVIPRFIFSIYHGFQHLSPPRPRALGPLSGPGFRWISLPS